MYLIFCSILLVFVYLVPALALFPRLIQSPKTMYTVPIISTGVVYALVTGFEAFSIYTAPYVLLATCTLTAVCVIRLKKLLPKIKWQFNGFDKFILMFIVLLMIPYFVKLGVEAFERGDEIYSWNFWGLQHLYNETIDYSHTSATYPQLFPKLLSYCYNLVGNIQLQCPVKALLGMFPLAMLGAWASVLAPFNRQRVVVFLLGVLYVMAGLKLEQFFNDGYADPIMTAMLVTSMALFLYASTGPSNEQDKPSFSKTTLYLLSAFCAYLAAAAKQPAIMWCVLILPVLIGIEAYKYKQKSWALISLFSITLGGIWFITEGNQFYNNQGVIYLSFEGRGYIEQFFHVSYRYLIKNPLLLIFFIFTALNVKTYQTRIIFYAFIVPQTFLWLMFGAYQLRLGQHVIAASTLLVFFALQAQQYPQWLEKLTAFCKSYQKSMVSAMVVLSLTASTLIWTKAVVKDKPGIRFVDGGRVSLQRYFGQDSDKVYQEIYLNKQAILWVPTRYIYGIFYKHTQLITPAYLEFSPYNEKAIVADLRKNKPDYVFTISEEVIDGPASSALKQVIAQCPNAFEVFATPPNKFDYTTYKLNHQTLLEDTCLNQFA